MPVSIVPVPDASSPHFSGKNRRSHSGRGLFITIDGPNGSGKTIVAQLLAEALRGKGHEVVVTSQPSDLKLGQLLRDLQEEYSGLALACMVAADRYDHLNRLILPCLNKRQVVISARYIESSLVLQVLDGVDRDFVWQLNSQVPIPDLSVVLRVSSETLENRLSARDQLSRFERDYPCSDESRLYDQAVHFLRQQGFRHLEVENDSRRATETVSAILSAIEAQSEGSK